MSDDEASYLKRISILDIPEFFYLQILFRKILICSFFIFFILGIFIGFFRFDHSFCDVFLSSAGSSINSLLILEPETELLRCRLILSLYTFPAVVLTISFLFSILIVRHLFIFTQVESGSYKFQNFMRESFSIVIFSLAFLLAIYWHPQQGRYGGSGEVLLGGAFIIVFASFAWYIFCAAFLALMILTATYFGQFRENRS
ncbi:hypothetical protein [Neorhizobium sp. T25_13]|uniref:hypothetical protein n=1 Tax=Neorhizobium sp. T25_13 TaxID=2093830 RepID=UPI00155EBB90|nr:hypothetical protein [Neorhizobium sp. T25_13]